MRLFLSNAYTANLMMVLALSVSICGGVFGRRQGYQHMNLYAVM
jgi:hypothetical protein